MKQHPVTWEQLHIGFLCLLLVSFVFWIIYMCCSVVVERAYVRGYEDGALVRMHVSSVDSCGVVTKWKATSTPDIYEAPDNALFTH